MTITIRIDEIQEQMLNDLIKKHNEEYPYVKITKSDIIRMAINQYHFESMKERKA